MVACLPWANWCRRLPGNGWYVPHCVAHAGTGCGGATHLSAGSVPCSCGRHLTWRCECGAITYGPILGDGCTPLHGPARVRG
jgi:hypothetical protein